MKKKYKFLILGCLLCTFSCTKWLTIDPKDNVLEDQVFGSEKGIQNALNGLYLKMANNNLYGYDLSLYTVECLAQRLKTIDATNDPVKYYVSQYSYGDNSAKGKFSEIWKAAYNFILSTNVFIEKVSAGEGVLSTEKKNIVLGEAYAMRAFMHFDLLRIFGPIYSAENSSVLTIPYYTSSTIAQRVRETSDTILQKIEADVEKSLTLLQNDPIITKGVMASNDYEEDFYAFRNRRLNYYAVSLLKLRILMYKGNRTAANTLATQLLSDINEKFPWTNKADVQTGGKTDYIFSSEVLFGIHSAEMYSRFESSFTNTITLMGYLHAIDKRNADYMFNSDISSSSDVRTLFLSLNLMEPDYTCIFKFKKYVTEDYNWYFQPLMRKSELYLILAECQSDTTYINNIRETRGVKRLGEEGELFDFEEELTREYQKEFINEGQLFYFYKRRNTSPLRSNTGTGTVIMNNDKYTVPVPENEIDY